MIDGSTIRKARQDKKLTLRELAAQTGKSIAFLSDLERGNRKPSQQTAQILASVLNISFSVCPACAGTGWINERI